MSEPTSEEWKHAADELERVLAQWHLMTIQQCGEALRQFAIVAAKFAREREKE